jgi:ribosomal protein L24E
VRRTCDGCKRPLARSRGHGFVSADGRAVLCGTHCEQRVRGTRVPSHAKGASAPRRTERKRAKLRAAVPEWEALQQLRIHWAKRRPNLAALGQAAGEQRAGSGSRLGPGRRRAA